MQFDCDAFSIAIELRINDMKPIRMLNTHLHNLKNLSLEIPRGQLAAITGVSGSGKSTLAFDLIFEEGRRRYLQSIGMVSDLVEETGCDRWQSTRSSPGRVTAGNTCFAYPILTLKSSSFLKACTAGQTAGVGCKTCWDK